MAKSKIIDFQRVFERQQSPTEPPSARVATNVCPPPEAITAPSAKPLNYGMRQINVVADSGIAIPFDPNAS
jgi:hypothetical protein